MATITTTLGNIEYTNFVGVNDHFVDAKVWEKEGECRVYFSVQHSKGREQCGYYDCRRKISVMRSSPAAWAHEIKASIAHEIPVSQ